MQLTTQTYGELWEMPGQAIRKQFSAGLGTITPKLGTDAASFNERGNILQVWDARVALENY